jgi:hypothetical protein
MTLITGVERFYSGGESGTVTFREEDARRPLDPRLDLGKLSLTGFAWGNVDASAQQLALALLADALQDDHRAATLAHEFAHRVISILPARWTITRTRILQHVEVIEFQLGLRPTPRSLFHVRTTAIPNID